MDEMTNADRAWLALFAVSDFTHRSGVDTPRDAIADLITNLLHLGRGHGLDTDLLVSQAAAMMREEFNEDEEGNMNEVQAVFLKLFNVDSDP